MKFRDYIWPIVLHRTGGVSTVCTIQVYQTCYEQCHIFVSSMIYLYWCRIKIFVAVVKNNSHRFVLVPING